MKTSLFILLICSSFLFSCNDDDNQVQYPKKFDFDHSVVINEKAYLMRENESLIEINPRAGNLVQFRSEVAADLYGYIRSLEFGTYVESIEFLSENLLRIQIWKNGVVNAFTFSANTVDVNIEISDQNFYISKVIWDKNKKEIKFCLALSLGILDRSGVYIPEVQYKYCEEGDINLEFQKILSDNEYQRNDTIGVYLLDMIYSE